MATDAEVTMIKMTILLFDLSLSKPEYFQPQPTEA